MASDPWTVDKSACCNAEAQVFFRVCLHKPGVGLARLLDDEHDVVVVVAELG